MHLLYNIGIWLFGCVIHTAALFENKKAQLWKAGRIGQIFPQEDGIVWVHCASLGEFEQGKPILEGLKKKGHKILLTFFSSSGYEAKKNYQGADWVRYLPLDQPYKVHSFLHTVKPKSVYFIKYEFWANYLLQLQAHKIPTYIVSAKFRQQQHFFKWYGTWFRKVLAGITHIFVQDKQSKILLNNIQIDTVTISGDSRFDTVIENTNNQKKIPLINTFKGNKKLVVCGSTWPQDERLLLEVMQQRTDLQFVFVPHEITNCTELQKKSKGLLYSQATEEKVATNQVLIIDSIGLLSQIYQYADLAYIGGGFGAGIHNTLEAAAFGCPILFGPNHHKFNEAQELIAQGFAQSITDADALLTAINSSDLQQQVAIQKYCFKNAGATEKILNKTQD